MARLKHWIVESRGTTYQVRSKGKSRKKVTGSKALTDHVNYLYDRSRQQHHTTKIVELKDAYKARARVEKYINERRNERRKAGKRGGGMVSYAQTFMFSLPSEIGHPKPDFWEAVAKRALTKIGKAVKIDPKRLLNGTGVVLHDESESEGKNSHIHMFIGKVLEDGTVVNALRQRAAAQAAKEAFNEIVYEKLNYNIKDYVVKQPGRREPLHVARKKALDQKTKEFKDVAVLVRQLAQQTQRLSKYVQEGNLPRIESTLNRIEKTEAEMDKAIPDQDKERLHIELPSEKERVERRANLTFKK